MTAELSYVKEVTPWRDITNQYPLEHRVQRHPAPWYPPLQSDCRNKRLFSELRTIQLSSIHQLGIHL
jgi:hypothetical protein